MGLGGKFSSFPGALSENFCFALSVRTWFSHRISDILSSFLGSWRRRRTKFQDCHCYNRRMRHLGDNGHWYVTLMSSTGEIHIKILLGWNVSALSGFNSESGYLYLYWRFWYCSRTSILCIQLPYAEATRWLNLLCLQNRVILAHGIEKADVHPVQWMPPRVRNLAEVLDCIPKPPLKTQSVIMLLSAPMASRDAGDRLPPQASTIERDRGSYNRDFERSFRWSCTKNPWREKGDRTVSLV